MVFLTVSNFRDGNHPAVVSREPEPLPPLLEAAEQTGLAAITWEVKPEALEALAQTLGPRLLIPEGRQAAFPQAGLLISSSISGGDLRQRFQTAARRRRCWLLPQRLSMEFPLPCPSGQGTPVPDVPQKAGFYSEALGCRYIHAPGRFCLFDTEETLRRKVQWAEEAGFCGSFPLP